jgi:rSAM/selenodomain-associated transferase 2
VSEPLLSVVIPALNEGGRIGRLLDDLSRLGVDHEVIVVDGGSTDDTADVARAHGAVVVASVRGRGVQLRAGAAGASAPMLCFLHADVRLPVEAVAALDALSRAPREGAWAFRLRLAGAHRSYRLVEWGANLRSRMLGLPYGDQGLVIMRPTYDAVGGFQAVPLMEDVMLTRALRRVGGVSLLPEHVVVSARRWEREGVMRRSMANLLLLARFLLGTPPATLASRYRAEEAGQRRSEDERE